MKQIIRDLKESWKENPWEMIGNFLFVVFIFLLFYATIWIHAIATGNY